jgi:mannose/fructose-specific phosphotransferase system component IIA
MVCALIVGHGQFAQGLLSALEQIVGPVELVAAVSTQGRSRAEIESQIHEARQKFGGQPLLVFADLQGGCGSTVCGSLLRAETDVGIIGGANLPMLVKYVQHREQSGPAELYRRLLAAGLDGIKGLKQPG